MTEARRVTVISHARPAADTSPTAPRVAPPGRAATAPRAARKEREARAALPFEAAKHDTFDEETDERWHDDGHRRGHQETVGKRVLLPANYTGRATDDPLASHYPLTPPSWMPSMKKRCAK